MLSYIIRRLLLVVPTLLGITVIVFTVMALSPGGTSADLMRGEGQMRPEERRARQEYLEKRYGLNKPLPVQYLHWLNKVSPIGFKDRADGKWGWPMLKVPDLGDSFGFNRPVLGLIAERLPITLLLNLISLPVVYAIAIFSGIKAARHRGQFVDVASGTVLLAMWSIPTIWAGVLLQGYLTNADYWRLFPTAGLHDIRADSMAFLPSVGAGGFERGWLLDTLWHLVLPVICLSYGSFAFLSKLARGAVLDTISADYVRTARAKGVRERAVLYVHVFRNSLLPLITVGAQILPGLLAGSVIVETIFGLPGMGRLAVEAVNMRDRELVLSDTLVAGILGLLGYLLADVGYAMADPRVTYE
ncbi:MAG: ABC transporter permease [Bacillota bacterium]